MGLARSGVSDGNLVDQIHLEVWESLPDGMGGKLRAYQVRRAAQGRALDQASLNAELARLARNRLRSYLRSEQSRRRHERAAARPEAQATPATAEQVLRVMRDVRDQLPPALQEHLDRLVEPWAEHDPGPESGQRRQQRSLLLKYLKSRGLL